jgi:chemotaxis protein CheD
MRRTIFLPPGGICCRSEPSVISTILGSCVAVCVWDREQANGGMNHFLLPRSNHSPISPRYGDVAVDRLLAQMEQLGCQMENLQAKVFGGAAVLPYGAHADTVGAQNVAVALEILQSLGIPVIARRTGGQCGLFIRFHTADGRVMVRELPANLPAKTQSELVS